MTSLRGISGQNPVDAILPMCLLYCGLKRLTWGIERTMEVKTSSLQEKRHLVKDHAISTSAPAEIACLNKVQRLTLETGIDKNLLMWESYCCGADCGKIVTADFFQPTGQPVHLPLPETVIRSHTHTHTHTHRFRTLLSPPGLRIPGMFVTTCSGQRFTRLVRYLSDSDVRLILRWS